MEIKGQRYKVEREIGKGAFGVVFLAQDNRLGRKVALKVMAIPDGLGEEDVNHLIERFYREARAAASLSHPNIVIIHDISKTKDRHFISMEFLEGKPLSELIDGPMPISRALDLMDQVLEGLEYAHSKGVIHRDVKPDNIFVLPGDKVKLVDFGLARVQTTSTLTKTGAVMGSPGYIAPEIIEGKRADARTDIFSAGVVIYEMLTGERPFGPKSSFESYANIIFRILSEDPKPPSSVNPGVTPALEEIVARCLAKNPDERYRAVDELRSALEEVAAAGTTEEDRGKAMRREKRGEKERKRLDAEAKTTDMSGTAGEAPDEKPDLLTRVEVESGPVEEYDLFPEEGAGRRRVSWKVIAVVAGSVLAAAAIAVVLVFLFATGGGTVACPNLVNLERDEAVRTIKSVGLKVGKETEAFSYDIWKGKVAKQMPSAGTGVRAGSTVDIVVSIGQDVAAVPEVINQPEAVAVTAITNYGFKVKRRFSFSNTVPATYIISVEPPAKTVKARGTSVTIVVSKGPFPGGSSVPPPPKSVPKPPPGGTNPAPQ